MIPQNVKNITESMLNQFYNKNGLVFKAEDSAKNFLSQEGFIFYGGFYKNRKGKKAYLHRLREAIFNNDEVVAYRGAGWLICLGGEPIAVSKLKFTSVKTGELV